MHHLQGRPGGDDYHPIWINPKHPGHMVTASDQGTVVTVDGGRTWSSWYNQPTGQFYHLAADNRFPYWIYSGQQDTGTVAIASRSDYGAITFRDWHPVGGDERDYDIPDPDDPEHRLRLRPRRPRQPLGRAHRRSAERLAVARSSNYGQRPTTVKHHYTWITPLVASRAGPPALYAGGDVLFRSHRPGRHWAIISPDLTGKQAGATTLRRRRQRSKPRYRCGYGVIYSIAPSPHRRRRNLDRHRHRPHQHHRATAARNWTQTHAPGIRAVEQDRQHRPLGARPGDRLRRRRQPPA